MRVALYVAAGTLALIFAWIAAASAIYCVLIGRLDLFVFPFTQWVEVAPLWQTNGWVTLWVVISAATPAALMSAVVYAIKQRRGKLRLSFGGKVKPQERGVTTNHGNARWQTIKEMREMYHGTHPDYGAIVIGEPYRVDLDRVANRQFNPRSKRTWGKGGKLPLLLDPCIDGPTHSIFVAGSGWFKSQVAVTQIMMWWGSKVILDPSCELGPMTCEALEARGERVFQLGMGVGAQGMNVLDWIDITHPEAEMHVKDMVSAVYDEKAAAEKADFLFTPMGRDLVTCMLASMLWDSAPGEPKTLAVLREGIVTSEKTMPDLLKKIHATTKSNLARQLASTLMEMSAAQTFTGVYVNAATGTSWLSTEPYAALVSNGLCTASDILSEDGPTTIFLQIPLSALDKAPGIARVLVAALVGRVILADGMVPGRILYLLDEAKRLGPMRGIEIVRDAGRKYMITLMMLYQSLGQITDQWGKTALDSWQQSISWMGFAVVASADAQEFVSKACGTHGVMAYSEGDNTGTQRGFARLFGSRSKGSNTSRHEIGSPLVRIDNFRSMRTDEQIILPARGMPIRCGRAIWFRRKELQKVINDSPFRKKFPERRRGIAWLFRTKENPAAL